MNFPQIVFEELAYPHGHNDRYVDKSKDKTN